MTKTVSYTNVHLTYTADLAGLRQAKSDMAAMNRVINQAKTDTQKYEEHVQKLDRLLANGKISQEQYNRALDAAKTKFLGAAQGARGYRDALSQLGGPMGMLSMGGIGVIGLATAGSVQQAKEAVRAYADLESTLVTLGVVYGDDARAAKDFAKFRQMAAVSPLETKDFTRSAQVMAQYGVAIDDIIPRLEAISEVAAGDSEKMATLSLAFGQVAANGRLMGQEVLQMVNAGFNPLAEISRTTGRNMQDLRKDMEKGLITFDMVAKAFDSATSAGGRFDGMNEKLGKTVNAQLAQLRDEFTKTYEAIGEVLVKSGVNDSMTKLSDLLKGINHHLDIMKKHSANPFNIFSMDAITRDAMAVAESITMPSEIDRKIAERNARIEAQSKYGAMAAGAVSSLPGLIADAGQTYADGMSAIGEAAAAEAERVKRHNIKKRAQEVRDARETKDEKEPTRVSSEMPKAIMANTQEMYRQLFGKQNDIQRQQLEEQKLTRLANEKSAQSLERLEAKPQIGVIE